MNKLIKKKFKCKLCKNKYPITDDMLRTVGVVDWYDHSYQHRGFSCPVCGQVYAFDTDGFGCYSWRPVFTEYRFLN